MRWSPPEQNAQTPSLGLGPLPVSSTVPTSEVVRAWSSTRYSSSTVCGRNALRTSGRSNATRTTGRSRATASGGGWSSGPGRANPRWYVRSVRSSKPSTVRQRVGSNVSETEAGSSGGHGGSLTASSRSGTLVPETCAGRRGLPPGAHGHAEERCIHHGLDRPHPVRHARGRLGAQPQGVRRLHQALAQRAVRRPARRVHGRPGLGAEDAAGRRRVRRLGRHRGGASPPSSRSSSSTRPSPC